jgi:hypothetical protein
VGKLNVVIEGTFMGMRDLCVCRFQIAKCCNTCSSHSRFAQEDRTLGAAILHQVLTESWGYPSGKNQQNSAGFRR